MGILDRLKKLLTGTDKTKKIRDANRVTNYGGGVTAQSTKAEIRRSVIKQANQEEERRESVKAAFKATTPTAQKTGTEVAKTATKKDAFNRANAFKATPPKAITRQSTALGTVSTSDIKSRTAKRNAYEANRKEQLRTAERLKPKIDAKYNSSTKEGRQRIKSGEWMSDPDVAKYSVLKHPVAESAARGALSGTTFGLSDLAAAKLTKGRARETEEFYQANKSKGAEFAGEMAGSLASFGLTGGLSKEAVAKVAPRTTARIGEGTTEFLAKNGLVRKAAEREAIRKLGITATKEEIDRFARTKAAKIVAALGEDAAINLTTGAVSDVTHSLIDSDDPVEFAKNMAINAGINVVLGGMTTVAPELYRGSALQDSMRAMGNDVADFGVDVARNIDNRRGSIDLSGGKKAAKPANEVIATGRNWVEGRDWSLWKDSSGNLYVGDPNDFSTHRSFGKDLPENRAKAQAEFDFYNNVRKPKEAAKAKSNAEKAAKAEERPRPEGVRKISDKKLLEMKKSGEINTLSSDEYKYYIYDRPEDDPFFEKWDAIGAKTNKKAKGEANKKASETTKAAKEPASEATEPETKTISKKKLEKRLKNSDKRLKALEEDIKKSSYATQYEQDRLSAQYTKELEFRKKTEAQIKEAEKSADGTITVGKGKKKAKKAADESNVTVTKGKEEFVEEPKKKKGGSKKKSEAKPKTEAKTAPKAVEAAEKGTAEAAEKTAKSVKSLENKIEHANNNIKRLEKQIKEKQKEGASEKSINYLKEQRSNEMQRRRELKKELKSLGASTESASTKVEPKTEIKPKAEPKVEEDIGIGEVNKSVKSLENKIEHADNNIKKFDKELKEKRKAGASEKSIAYTQEQRKKEMARRRELKKELRELNSEASAVKTAGETEPATVKDKALNPEAEVKPPKKSSAKKVVKPKDENLKVYKQKQAESIAAAKAEAENTVDVGGKKYAGVDESPFDEASTRTSRQKPKFTPTENVESKAEKKAKDKLKEAKGKAKSQENRFRRNPLPRGEGLNKNVSKAVTGKELDEAINPPSFKDYLDAKKTHLKGQISREKEVVSRAGTSLMNATTAESQRDFLREGWRDGNFNYRKIRNKEKYAEVMQRFVKEPDAVSREIVRYNDDLSSLSADKVVDTHYQAHCVMKMLRKELDNPALTEAERASVREIYSSAASLSQKLSSLSGQVNQFQGVMVHCTPAKRADNALDNIVSILDSSRGYRNKAKIEIDGKKVALSKNNAERRQQIRSLILENEDISKTLNKVFDATTEQEYGEAMSELLMSTYKLNHATGFDYLQQWRYLSMLGNPKTHLRNIIGNVTFGAIRNASNTVRSIEEKAFEGYATKHGLDIDWHGGLSPKAHGQARIRKLANDDASKAAWDAFDKHKNEILGQDKYDTPQLATLFRHLSEGNTKLLGWEDDLFRAPAYREQYIKSYKKFAKKGEITDEVLSRIHTEALKESRIATFNEFNELAQILAKSQRGLYDANATVGQKGVALLSNALMPFTKVPANILKQSVNYTPAGAVKGVSHILDAAAKGDSELFNTALDELASGITGTGIAALGYFFGRNTDIFTTNAGSEDAAAKFKKAQGVQNYSATVDLPDGKTYSFTLDWLVPASCTFFMGVELAKQFENGIQGAHLGEAIGNISQVTSRVIDPVLETSMLSGIYNIVENSRKSSSYDDQRSFADIAFREIVQSYLSSYVPTALGQVARSFIYDADKFVTGDGDWDYWTNSMKVKMGLANTDILTERLGDDTNAYGEVKNKKKDSGDYAKSFVKNAVLPTNIQEVNLTETDKQKIKEYEDYVAAGGDPADKEYLFPKKQYRTNFSYGKKGADPVDVKMTNEQVSLYNQAKTSGGEEGMRVVLEGAMFNHYDKDSSGKRTILKNGYTAEQKEKLIAKFNGKSMREVEEWLYKQPQFNSATEEEKRKVLNALWSYSQGGASKGSKRVGEMAVIKDQGGDLNEYNFKNEISKTKQLNLQDAIDSGIVTYEEAVDFARYAGKTYYYDNDEGGSSSTYYNKKQMLEYLESKGYSEEKAAALFNAFKQSNAKEYGASGRGYYRRRGYRRWRRRGRRGGKGSSAKMNVAAFKSKKISASKASKATPPKTRVSVKSTANVGGITKTHSTANASAYKNIALNVKTAKPSKSSKGASTNLSAALEDIKKTQKKVAPPKARKSK